VLFFWGVNIFALIPCQTTYVQRYVDKAYLGRTFALLDQATFVPEILGAMLVTAIGTRVRAADVLTLAGLLYLAVVVSSLGTSGSRLLRRRGTAPVEAALE
jgi:hypothetical protein